MIYLFFFNSFILLENISWLKLKEEKTVLINVSFRNKVPKVAEVIPFDIFKTKNPICMFEMIFQFEI